MSAFDGFSTSMWDALPVSFEPTTTAPPIESCISMKSWKPCRETFGAYLQWMYNVNADEPKFEPFKDRFSETIVAVFSHESAIGVTLTQRKGRRNDTVARGYYEAMRPLLSIFLDQLPVSDNNMKAFIERIFHESRRRIWMSRKPGSRRDRLTMGWGGNIHTDISKFVTRNWF
ncbi:hypothetical protein RSOLAG1IB_01968 [Rhizoctonia solani AG-1 IB]|uniref:Uncharacterized protein n=1 Tax=Thanatephorus cucumeris (strain AG1-IB / isolate 7/3/14) TaxID=1108050 RepID=A0A0B7FEC4_THACB|nr:hypothetical protein RSOLAG1IB_01968 [Rhizoctonia solani AG-1 IB]